MYNLVVSGSTESFDGEPFTLEVGRCVREYTDEALTARFGDLGADAVAELIQLPTVFAYENGRNKAPIFGRIRDIAHRKAHGLVRLEYDLMPLQPFLTHEQLAGLGFELDISKWELNRTHWALKDVDLPKELHGVGVTLPDWTRPRSRRVDITSHVFDVGLSFPGEARGLVEAVAQRLEHAIGPDRYFYDNNYIAQLARPNLDVLLQEVYRHRSRLVVVFIGQAYQAKDWCGIEWRAIREIIAERRDAGRIMFVRVDDGEVDGVFKTDGYVDARRHDPDALAAMIAERAQMLERG
jgi:hypothetical protein